MVTAAKTDVVEDAEPDVSSGIPAATFPGTLTGLLDALNAARYRSAAAGTPMALIIMEGSQRQPIRRFESGLKVWSASTAEIRRHGDPSD
jgi:hypothetical protein